MAAAELHVEVVFGDAPDHVDRVELKLADGATVGDALRASGLAQRHALDWTVLTAGVWGRVQPLDHALRDRDRVEVWRPLAVDPKEARRLRYKRQRAKVEVDGAGGGPIGEA